MEELELPLALALKPTANTENGWLIQKVTWLKYSNCNTVKLAYISLA
jgi:hypothetical protein